MSEEEVIIDGLVNQSETSTQLFRLIMDALDILEKRIKKLEEGGE